MREGCTNDAQGHYLCPPCRRPKDCVYCTEPSVAFCSSCDRPICDEHAHRAEGEVFCEPLPDETVRRYIATGAVPKCGEEARC